MKFTVVIPAFNEEVTIRDIVQKTLKYTSDIIVVDDGSTDATNQNLHDLPIILIKHTENKGKAASLRDGIYTAINNGSDIIITLDGDGQHSPDDIPLLLNAASSRPDTIIIGARLSDKKAIPAKRYYANKIANFWISWAAGYKIDDSQSGFRLYPASVFKDLNISVTRSKSFVFESEILIKAAQRNIYSHPVTIPAIYSKTARPSHFRGVRDIACITRMVAIELLSRGLYLKGLYHVWLKPLLPISHYQQTGLDGYFTLLLSILLIIFSGGLTYLFTYGYILRFAIKSSQQDIKKTDIFLVLGRKLCNNQPDRDYILRLDCAASLLHKSGFSKVLILGGCTGKSNVSESYAGKIYLVSRDISSKRVIIEESSRNTLENIQQIKNILSSEKRQIVIISNRYHLARIKIIADGFAIDSIVYPAEEKFTPIFQNIIKILPEAFHLHWYLTGRIFARVTKNRKMLARIS